MNRFAVLICGVLLLTALACDQGPAETKSQSPATTASTPVATAAPVATAESGPASLAGTTIALADGAEVEIISVGSFDQNYKSLSGVVAIEGRVAEVFPDRGAFVLVDYDRMADCQTGCCPQAEVPVRLVLDDFAGDLPKAEDTILVIADLAVGELGYELIVNEIRAGDTVLLSREPAKA